MKLKYLITNYKSELQFIGFMILLLIAHSYFMLPVASHGAVNPICDFLIGDHITCTTSP